MNTLKQIKIWKQQARRWQKVCHYAMDGWPERFPVTLKPKHAVDVVLGILTERYVCPGSPPSDDKGYLNFKIEKTPLSTEPNGFCPNCDRCRDENCIYHTEDMRCKCVEAKVTPDLQYEQYDKPMLSIFNKVSPTTLKDILDDAVAATSKSERDLLTSCRQYVEGVKRDDAQCAKEQIAEKMAASDAMNRELPYDAPPPASMADIVEKARLRRVAMEAELVSGLDNRAAKAIQNAPDNARVIISYPGGTDAFDIKALKELVGKAAERDGKNNDR